MVPTRATEVIPRSTSSAITARSTANTIPLDHAAAPTASTAPVGLSVLLSLLVDAFPSPVATDRVAAETPSRLTTELLARSTVLPAFAVTVFASRRTPSRRPPPERLPPPEGLLPPPEGNKLSACCLSCSPHHLCLYKDQLSSLTPLFFFYLSSCLWLRLCDVI